MNTHYQKTTWQEEAEEFRNRMKAIADVLDHDLSKMSDEAIAQNAEAVSRLKRYRTCERTATAIIDREFMKKHTVSDIVLFSINKGPCTKRMITSNLYRYGYKINEVEKLAADAIDDLMNTKKIEYFETVSGVKLWRVPSGVPMETSKGDK